MAPPAGSQATRLPAPLMTLSAIPALPAGLMHGQSVTTVLVVYLVMAAFSHACSSSGGFSLNAFCTNLSWHLMIAPASWPLFPAAFCSHFDLALSSVRLPPSSPPGHGMAPAVPYPIATASAAVNTAFVRMSLALLEKVAVPKSPLRPVSHTVRAPVNENSTR